MGRICTIVLTLFLIASIGTLAVIGIDTYLSNIYFDLGIENALDQMENEEDPELILEHKTIPTIQIILTAIVSFLTIFSGIFIIVKNIIKIKKKKEFLR
jgi:hypothetical protein